MCSRSFVKTSPTCDIVLCRVRLSKETLAENKPRNSHAKDRHLVRQQSASLVRVSCPGPAKGRGSLVGRQDLQLGGEDFEVGKRQEVQPCPFWWGEWEPLDDIGCLLVRASRVVLVRWSANLSSVARHHFDVTSIGDPDFEGRQCLDQPVVTGGGAPAGVFSGPTDGIKNGEVVRIDQLLLAAPH